MKAARRRQAGHRLQRQDPGEGRQERRRDRQRQDVDEPVRRDRRRGGDAAQGGRHGERDRRRVDGPAGMPGNDPHRARHGRRPRHPCPDRRRAAAARRGEAAEGDRRARKRRNSSSSASRRSTTTATRPARCWRRCSGWPQATFASKLKIADGKARGDARGRWRARDGRDQAAGDRHHRSAAQRAALCLAAQHHEGEEEADRGR